MMHRLVQCEYLVFAGPPRTKTALLITAACLDERGEPVQVENNLLTAFIRVIPRLPGSVFLWIGTTTPEVKSPGTVAVVQNASNSVASDCVIAVPP